MGGQKQEVESLGAGDIPYGEVTKIYDATDTVTMKDKRGTHEPPFFFQNYLRDTGIVFEFACRSPANTQTFKKKKQGEMTSC